MTDEENFCYVLVGNIPSKFHSVDLRSFFSQLIETGKFDCFHFRHRPEILKKKIDTEKEETKELKGKTTCCVVKLRKEYVKELLEVYNGENWTDKNGKLCCQKAIISRILIKNVSLSNVTYQTREETRNCKRENVEFVMADLQKLSELHPPSFMPNGNIGTSLRTFMTLIRTCQLPPHIIKKLGLSFPSSRSKHCYGNVRFDYGSDKEDGISLWLEGGRDGNPMNDDEISQITEEKNLECVGEFQNEKTNTNMFSEEDRTSNDRNLTDPPATNSNKIPRTKRGIQPDQDASSSDTESEPEEDWERHEALHDDVDCQGRTKERLFENKIELKWEKGGSGLVFYTDAAYWESLSGDFDEQTADDWDIDMGIYEKGGYGDRHSKALMEIRMEEHRRLSLDDNTDSSKIGDFEKHTKGFGSKLMKNHGWSEGSSLGSSQAGITEPIPNEGQLPRCKTGLGYYGEKLNRHVKRPRVEKDVVISTVFDKTNNEKLSTPKQSAGPFTLKYRNKMEFVRQSDKRL